MRTGSNAAAPRLAVVLTGLVLTLGALGPLGCAAEHVTEVSGAPGSPAAADTWADLRLWIVERNRRGSDIE